MPNKWTYSVVTVFWLVRSNRIWTVHWIEIEADRLWIWMSGWIDLFKPFDVRKLFLRPTFILLQVIFFHHANSIQCFQLLKQPKSQLSPPNMDSISPDRIAFPESDCLINMTSSSSCVWKSHIIASFMDGTAFGLFSSVRLHVEAELFI